MKVSRRDVFAQLTCFDIEPDHPELVDEFGFHEMNLSTISLRRVASLVIKMLHANAAMRIAFNPKAGHKGHGVPRQLIKTVLSTR